MRATMFLLMGLILIGLFLWVILSGALLLFGVLAWIILIVITVSYQDTMILFLLGAREVRSSDEKKFFEAASQEAYKLAVPMPRLYFYNGTLERVFVLQKRQMVSVIFNKVVLEKCTQDELKAISFELLLQVKKGMATKRTKVIFLLGCLAWIVHSFTAIFLFMLPFNDFKKAANWFLNYLLHPALELLFKFTMGDGYFKKLATFLDDFPHEKEMLVRVGLKISRPHNYYSISSRKLLELSSVYKSHHFQNIMAIEFLPHEWDYLFSSEEIKRVE